MRWGSSQEHHTLSYPRTSSSRRTPRSQTTLAFRRRRVVFKAQHVKSFNIDTSLILIYTDSCNSEHNLNHDFHDFQHEGGHQKARSRARFLARRRALKSTIFATKENTQNKIYINICLTVTAIWIDPHLIQHLLTDNYCSFPVPGWSVSATCLNLERLFICLLLGRRSVRKCRYHPWSSPTPQSRKKRN